MKKSYLSLIIIGTALAAGCDLKGGNGLTSAPAVNKADAVASVNGQYIAKSALEELEKEIAERSHGQQTVPKDKLLEELIQREVLVQSALQKHLDKSPELISQLETIKKTLLTNMELQNFVKANPITDAEIKAEYDSQIASNKGVEYKARHILVKTEKEAKERIAELDKGADFAKLANKYSIDAKESKNGGDLGWFQPGQMVPPFSEAVAKLEKGKYSKTPVKTQFGWHVILREDSRPVAPPPFDAVKEQIKPFLQRKKIQNMVEALRKQAKVETFLPKEEPKPKTEGTAAETKPAEGEKTPAAAGSASEKSTTENAAEAAAVTTEKAAEASEKTAETAKSTPAEAKK